MSERTGTSVGAVIGIVVAVVAAGAAGWWLANPAPELAATGAAAATATAPLPLQNAGKDVPAPATSSDRPASLPAGATTANVGLPEGATPPDIAALNLALIDTPSGLVIEKPGDADTVIERAVEAAGGREALEAMRAATLRVYVRAAGMRDAGRLVHGRGGQVALHIDGQRLSYGMRDGGCWWREGAVTAPCFAPSRIVVRLLNAVHDATLLTPLLEAPWQRVSAHAVRLNGKISNIIQFSSDDAELEIAIWFDPLSHRPIRVQIEELGRQQSEVAWADLSDDGTFAGVKVPMTRKITVSMGAKARRPWEIRVLSAKLGSEDGDLAHSEWTVETPMARSVRRALKVVEAKAQGGHQAFVAAEVQAQAACLPHASPLLHWPLEVLGPPTSMATLESSVACWYVLRDHGDGVEPKVASPARIRQVPATLALVTRVLRLPFDEVPAAVIATATAARAAGHTLADAPVVIRYLSDASGENHEVTIEVQLVIGD